ncbi:MAG: tRNA (adenosine(37)-N6)-threonylcarbamoyltransferase complex ATPase subunit type 1 TsaE [Candidatus Saccharibacteria bacterium]|nr:tRNA (adenosine(37)-N6)-threonylcarbamoyltransferase complex ATPase subunit type 1 TsaE [Candidatus Saccharibacteria bacterium]
MQKIVSNFDELEDISKWLVNKLPAKFCLEMVGDVGAGKTTLTKFLVAALGSNDEVTSPSFTINNRYDLTSGHQISHYDFYRLGEAGVLSQELAEDLANPNVSVIIEWAGAVNDLLPADRIKLRIQTLADNTRQIVWERIDD